MHNSLARWSKVVLLITVEVNIQEIKHRLDQLIGSSEDDKGDLMMGRPDGHAAGKIHSLFKSGNYGTLFKLV